MPRGSPRTDLAKRVYGEFVKRWADEWQLELTIQTTSWGRFAVHARWVVDGDRVGNIPYSGTIMDGLTEPQAEALRDDILAQRERNRR